MGGGCNLTRKHTGISFEFGCLFHQNVPLLGVNIKKKFTDCSIILLTKRTKKESLHPWVKVDQAGRPLPPKST